MPSIQSMWVKNRDKGLHIFLVESQSATTADMEKYTSDRGLTFPIAILNESDFGGYDGGRGLPYAFVIGVNGKVIWQGNKGYHAVLEKELGKIKYLGLGKNEIAKGLEKAATEFSKKNYAKAHAAATKLKEKKADNEALVADAQYIIEHVKAKADFLRDRIDEATQSLRYHEAVRDLQALAKGFKGMEVAAKATVELKALKKDKTVKKELKAWGALTKLLNANKKVKGKAKQRKNLIAFYKKNEGMAAAEEARVLADRLG